MDTDNISSSIGELQKEIATLRRENQEYRRLASFPLSNPLPVLEFDRDGQLVFINPTARKALTQLGWTDANVFLPSDYADIYQTANHTDGQQFIREIEIGDQTFEETIYYSQEYDSIRVYTSDITKRKQMETDLRINLTKYAVLFDTLPLGVTLSDQNGNVVESNQEASTLLGLSEEEQKHRKIGSEKWKVVRLDGTTMPAQEYASVRAFQEQRRIENIEMGVVKGKHDITWISVTASPIPLENFGVVITYNDISKRIQAEEALHQAHERLESMVQQRTEQLLRVNTELRAEINERKRVESELLLQTRAVEAQRHRFNDVLEILPMYTVLLTLDYRVSFANRYFRERFGEDHGHRCYEYLFGLTEPCENCETFKCMQTGTSHHWEWTGPDGRNYDVFDYPFNDTDGSALILELGIDVTKRKQAEEELHQLNAYNRSLIEANLDALVTITPDGKVGDANAVTEAITGYPREKLIGTAFYSYFTNPEKARAGYERVFDTGTVRDYELEIQHRDGHTTPVIYNASVYLDESGKVGGILAAARDITERKHSDEKLRQLSAYNRSLIEASLDALVTITSDGKIGDVNAVTEAMTGYSRAELIGTDFSSYFTDPEKACKGYQKVFETGNVHDYELEIQHRDGHTTPVVYNASVYRDEYGNVAGVFAAARDITERKAAEEALRKSEELYRSLVIATAQIVWQSNADGEMVEDNPLWRTFTGQSKSEFIGRGWINAIHFDDQQRVAQSWAKAVQSKSSYETECRIRSQEGGYNNFSLRSVPIKDLDGNVSGWIGTCTDITEKKNYENQLLQAEKHAVIGRMVGSVTHEINNPLQTIKNCLYLIKQDTNSDSPVVEPLEMALSETQRLSNIVGQLRQLYRPQSSQTMQPCGLLDIIEEVHALINLISTIPM